MVAPLRRVKKKSSLRDIPLFCSTNQKQSGLCRKPIKLPTTIFRYRISQLEAMWRSWKISRINNKSNQRARDWGDLTTLPPACATTTFLNWISSWSSSSSCERASSLRGDFPEGSCSCFFSKLMKLKWKFMSVYGNDVVGWLYINPILMTILNSAEYQVSRLKTRWADSRSGRTRWADSRPGELTQGQVSRLKTRWADLVRVLNQLLRSDSARMSQAILLRACTKTI